MYMAYTLSYLYKRFMFFRFYPHGLFLSSNKIISSYTSSTTRYMIGDILLCKKELFRYGLNAFLIGDIAFLFFYYHFEPFTYIELIVPVCAMILLEILAYYKIVDLSTYKTELTSYIFALVWLTTKAILTAFTLNTLSFIMMATGLILYLISDILLAFYKTNKIQILGILKYFLLLFWNIFNRLQFFFPLMC